MSGTWKQGDTNLRQEQGKKDSSGVIAPKTLLRKLLRYNYKQDALALLEATIEVILDEQPKIWVRPSCHTTFNP